MSDDLFALIDALSAVEEGELGSAPAPTLSSRARHPRWPSFTYLSALVNSATMDFHTVLEAILDTAVSATNARRGYLLLLDEGDQLEVEIGRDDEGNTLAQRGDHPYSRTIVERTLASRTPVIIPDSSGAGFNDMNLMTQSVADLGLRSAMCVCLELQGTLKSGGAGTPSRERRKHYFPPAPDLLGALYVDSNVTTYTFDEEDLDFFKALANQATATIISARLYQQATTDPLTEVYSRRHFENLLEEAQRSHERTDAPYTLLLLDLDKFKQVNDQHGHVMGDRALAELARILRQTVRARDCCFRYGGEEFAVLCSNTDAKGGLVLAEKIRNAIHDHRIPGLGRAVTVSIGLSSYPEHARDKSELVKKADQALYLAKEEGRDRVRVWSEDISGSARRKDRLAGIFTGDFARDYNNVQLLLDTISAINSTMDLEELLTLTIDKVIDATGAERGALMLTDGAELETVVARNRLREDLQELERFSTTIPRRVFITGESVCVVDTLESEERDRTKSVAELNLRTIMCVPLMTRNGSMGVIYVDSRSLAGDLKESNLPFFEALARQVAFAIENARLRARLAYEGGLEQG